MQFNPLHGHLRHPRICGLSLATLNIMSKPNRVHDKFSKADIFNVDLSSQINRPVPFKKQFQHNRHAIENSHQVKTEKICLVNIG